MNLDQYQHLTTTECERGWRWYGTAEQAYQYPSVSTIQQATIAPPPALIDWWMDNTRSKIELTLQDAAEWGTKCHDYFSKLLYQEESKVADAFLSPVKKFKEWQFKHNVKPVGREFTVVSKKYGYAGRVDALAEVDGKVELLDWKTGNKYKDDWASQAGGYHLAVKEMLGIKSDDDLGIRLVHIPRSGEPLKEFKFQHLDFIQDSFLLCLERFKRAPNFNYLKKKGWNYVLQPIFERRPV